MAFADNKPVTALWLSCSVLLASTAAVVGQSSSAGSKYFAPDIFASHVPSLSGSLHRLMAANELHHHFGTSDVDKIPQDYHVVVIQEFTVRVHPDTNEVDNDGPVTVSSSGSSIYPKTRRIVIDVPKSSFGSSSGIVDEAVERLQLDMHRNPWLIPKGQDENHCHYIHHGANFTASASICTPNEILGMIVQPNRIVQVHPISHTLRQTLKASKNNLLESYNGVPHIVRSVTFDELLGNVPKNGSWCGVSEEYQAKQKPAGAPSHPGMLQSLVQTLSQRPEILQAVEKRDGTTVLNVEVGLFVDTQAHGIFLSYFGSPTKEDAFYCAYMNAVQAIFHEGGLWRSVQVRFQIVLLKKLTSEPFGMVKAAGERSDLLKAFCQFCATLNKAPDTDPTHFDMCLLLTGQNLYAMERGKPNYVTMGLAYVGGACYDKANCVIAELGVTTDTGKPYPAAGLLAAYVGAHEVAHNLGVRHDTTNIGCPKDGFLMSPSKGFTGEQKWSTCSKRQLEEAIAQGKLKCVQEAKQTAAGRIDNDKQMTDPQDEPGQQYDHTEQCRLFLKDTDAHRDASEKLEDICKGLYCESPNRYGKYLAGSAIDGTFCGTGKVCRDGDCVGMTPEEKTALKVVPGKESNQMLTGCTSKCLEGSMGASETKIVCEGRKNTLDGCTQDLKIVVKLCNDSPICPTRQSPKAYATEQCAKFAKYAPTDLSATSAEGFHHMGYDANKPWESCAIFCKTKYNYEKAYIQDLNDLWEIPKKFPDGTLCHKDGATNYYCMAGECRKFDPKDPESFDSSVSYLKKALKNVDETALPDGTAPASGLSAAFRSDFTGTIADAAKQYESKARTGEFTDDDGVEQNTV